MPFMDGFADELVKTAGPGAGRLAKMLGIGRKAEQAAAGGLHMGLGKSLLLAGGAGAGAAALGAKVGRKKGFEEGTNEEMDVAQQARLLGRKEGVLAYHQALQARLREAQGG